jgi:hypothetical protein
VLVCSGMNSMASEPLLKRRIAGNLMLDCLRLVAAVVELVIHSAHHHP